MFADASHQPFGNEGLRGESLSHRACDEASTAPIVFHGEMLKVLLNGRHRKNRKLQLACIHARPKFTSGEFI